MNEKINAELTKLQDELSVLDSAVKQIDKAGQISEELISSLKNIQVKYVEHLDVVKNQVEQLYLSTEGKVSDLQTAYKTHLDETFQIVTDFKKGVEDKNLSQQDILNKSFISTQKQVGDLVTAHQAQIDEVNRVLTSYLELAQATTKLYDQIEKVDFPLRLSKIDSAVNEMNNDLAVMKVAVNKMVENDKSPEILAGIKKSQRRTRTLQIFIVILIVLILAFGFEVVVLKYFPNLLRF